MANTVGRVVQCGGNGCVIDGNEDPVGGMVAEEKKRAKKGGKAAGRELGVGSVNPDLFGLLFSYGAESTSNHDPFVCCERVVQKGTQRRQSPSLQTL